MILPDIFHRTLTFPLHVVSGLKVRSKDQWKPSEGWVLPGSAQRRLSGGDRCVNWLTEWTLICFLTDQMMERDCLVVKTTYCLCLLAANRDQQWNLFYHCFPSFVCLSLPFCTFRKENPKHEWPAARQSGGSKISGILSTSLSCYGYIVREYYRL